MKDIYNNYKDIGLFNNGNYLVYSYKKAEKIVSAIYIVTNLIKDSDPLKWELRESSMSFLASLMTLNGIESIDRNRLLQSFFNVSVQLISFLNISFVSGIISNMNSSMIINELEKLIEYIRNESKSFMDSTGFILSDSFFATDIKVENSNISTQNYKGHSTPKVISNIDKNQFTNVKDKKNSRKDNIIDLLRKGSDLTIKDFVKVINDCSEKTIQRELIQLVEKGIVVKKGERRWSTYSLA